MKNIQKRHVVFIMVLAIFSMDCFSQRPVLFVGRDNIGDYQSDQDLYDSLISWGYVPEFVGSGNFSTFVNESGDALNYDNYEAIFINETVDSKSMLSFGTTDNYPLPCINMEGYVVSNTNDRWAWLADASTELIQTAEGEGTEDDMILVIQDDSHYITYNYDEGDEVEWSSATEADDIVAIRPVSIEEVNLPYSNILGVMKSQEGESSFANFLTIDEIGESDNKMVFWGLNHVGLNGVDQTKNLGTVAFYDLIHRSCEWAYDDAIIQSVNNQGSENMNLVAFPNPAETYVTVRYYARGNGPMTATLFNMAGQRVDERTKKAHYGKNYLILDGRDYESGIYNLHVEVGNQSSTTKVVIK